MAIKGRILIGSCFFWHLIGIWLLYTYLQQTISINLFDPFQASQNNEPLTFWALSLHHGCRVDTATSLQGLGQTIIIGDHFQRENYYPNAITRPNIIFPTDSRKLAPLMYSHKEHSNQISENDTREFFDYYRSDPLIMKVNAFYCSFPSSLCEIFMPFNRTIIWLPAHRFTLGKCSRAEIDRLILHMQQSIEPNRQPKNFIAAGGRYDQEYIKYYTGVDAILLPVNSLWYAFNVTNFTQNRSEILVGPLQYQNHPLIRNMTDAAIVRNSSFRFSTSKTLYNHYSLQQITDHRAIVLLPYAVLSYGITELYALGIPIFVPTIEFLVQLELVTDRTLIDIHYCGRSLKFSDLPPQHPKSTHPYSPDDLLSSEAIAYWLQFADYYQLPYIQQFSSWIDLIDKLAVTNFQEVHDNMFKHNLIRRNVLIRKWTSIFKEIDPMPRMIPQDYSTAIEKLWNTTKLQAV